MRLALAAVLVALLLLGEACVDDPSVQSRTPAVASTTAPKTLVTTSAARIDPAPGYRIYTNAEGITFAIPPGFEFKKYHGDGALWNEHGASIAIGEAPLCGRPLTDICNTGSGAPGWTREITASSCFETGHKGNTITWERSRVAGEAIYYLSISYPASERAQFDDIIERVYRSWKLPDPPSDGGWCGSLPSEREKAWSDAP